MMGTVSEMRKKDGGGEEGQRGGEEGSVSGSGREGGVGLRRPHRHRCNLGHVSQNACWSPRGLAG